MDEVANPKTPPCWREDMRVAWAMSEIKKKITLNNEVLTNSTAQCAPDMLFLVRRLDRFLECLAGFAIENLFLNVYVVDEFSGEHLNFEAQYRLFEAPKAR
jgi:hypothetical protein